MEEVSGQVRMATLGAILGRSRRGLTSLLATLVATLILALFLPSTAYGDDISYPTYPADGFWQPATGSNYVLHVASNSCKETGHSQGLAHHCTSDSVMNNGDPSCNFGRWQEVTGYMATDRAGVVNAYPAWPY